MKLFIERLTKGDKQTLGFLSVLNEENEVKYKAATLELPDKNNQRNISCIPAGTYKVKKRYSRKFKNHFHIQNVEGRSYILIHAGNYYTQIRGCILVGSEFKDLNRDGLLDVANSKATMKDLLEIMPDEFELTILEDHAQEVEIKG